MDDLNGVSHFWKISDIVELCRNDVNYITDPSRHFEILFKAERKPVHRGGDLKSRCQKLSCSMFMSPMHN